MEPNGTLLEPRYGSRWCVRQAGALPSPRGCAVLSPAVRASAQPTAKLVLFGGSSDWDDEAGGATALHGDIALIDLSNVLSLLERVAVGEVVLPGEEADEASNATEAAAAGLEGQAKVGAKAATHNEPNAPSEPQQPSKRKKSAPIKRVAGSLD